MMAGLILLPGIEMNGFSSKVKKVDDQPLISLYRILERRKLNKNRTLLKRSID
jgi:hypothetical protein